MCDALENRCTSRPAPCGNCTEHRPVSVAAVDYATKDARAVVNLAQ